MAIFYDSSKNTFYLETDRSSYIMQVTDNGLLLHLYYGMRIHRDSLSYLLNGVPSRTCFYPVSVCGETSDNVMTLPQEFSTDGVGDYRFTSIQVVNADGSFAFDGRYAGYRIQSGKYRLDGLPSLFEAQGDTVDSLILTLEDPVTHLRVELLYGVYEQKNVITRAVRVINDGKNVRLTRIMSVNLDFLDEGYDLIHFRGHHYMERLLEREHITHSAHEIGSCTGTSSHIHNPAVILCRQDTTEDYGDCYGAVLLYSGNFISHVKTDAHGQTRFAMGIHPEKFDFSLQNGDVFTAPEVVLCYSDGLAQLTHTYHDVFRENACPSKYLRKKRPVLVNNWEATRFSFDGNKIVDIARASKALGVDLFVLDDGWFGARNSSMAGLGDWFVNEEKLGGSLSDVISRINSLGLKFGLWFEPEMINEDSELYRTHPDWALQIPGRQSAKARNQLVLDISRQDVRDHLVSVVNAILDDHPIEYVKWDFNRYLSDVYSVGLPAQRQGEVYHRFVLGVYDLLDRIVLSHPDILFEGCSGGGGRFDGGMLCYHPQIWCSDDTDAIWRTRIQYGTSFFYPCSAMGAHVSVCPNKKTGRIVPFETRAAVAMSGTFGYELDTTKMTQDEINICAEQTELFRRYYDLICFGNYYRLTDSFMNARYTAWEHVAKNGSEALVTVVILECYPSDAQQYVCPKGLDPNGLYETEDGLRLHGSALMKLGLPIPLAARQYESFRFHLKRI